MEYIISTVWIFMEVCAFILFYMAFLPAKKSLKQTALLSCITAGVIAIVVNVPLFSFLPPFMNILLVLAISFALFGGKWYTHVYLLLFSYVFAGITDLVIAYGEAGLLNITVDELAQSVLGYTFAGTLSKLITIYVFWVIFRYRAPQNQPSLSGKWLILTVLFPIVSVILLALNFYGHRQDEELSMVVVWIGLVTATANFCVLYLLDSLCKATEQDMNIRLLEQQMELQEDRINALEKNYRQQRKATHEYEHHLLTAHELLVSEQIEEAQKYFTDLLADRSSRVFSVNSGHPVIDILLNEAYQKASDKDIRMTIQVSDLSSITISTKNLSVLLANLLDNAIEAAEKAEPREILCAVVSDDDVLNISVKNTSLPVTIVNGKIPSTKEGTLDHGYGLMSIEYVLKKVNAEYAYSYSDGWFCFAIEIPH